MKPGLLIAALALPLLASCANSGHEDDAADLRDRLAGLPGVEGVKLDYTKPVILDSGKLGLRVEMGTGVAPVAIIKVVTTTYAAFADAHHGEEGDLDVVVGDDVIHLRSFEPDAGVGAVSNAAARAAAVLPSGSVEAHINTQDVSKTPHVFTTYAVAVEKPGRDSVLKRLAELEKDHGDIPDSSWRVQSGGESGWLLGADQGFPAPEARALFDQLSNDLPQGAVIQLIGDFATVQLPSGTTPEEASRVVSRHLPLLGGAKKAFYDVEDSQELLAAITKGECFFDTGTVGERLETDYKAGCTTVTHPEQ